MKWFKRILMLIVALLLVGVLAVVAFVATFDPNDYKQRIAQVVKEKTGRTIHFNGDISLTIFPWLGVTIKNVALSNATGFAPKDMVSAQEVEAKAALLPLLKGQFEIGKLVLDSAVINLERKANGKTNWDDLVAAGGKAPAGRQPAEQSKGSAAKPLALAVGGVDIRNSTINWRDDLSKQQVTLQKLQLQTGALAIEQPVSLHAGFDYGLQLPGQKPLQGSLALDGTIRTNASLQTLHASNLKLVVKAADNGGGDAMAATGLPQQAEVSFTAPSAQVSLANHSANLPSFDLKVQASKLGSLSYVDAKLGGDLTADWAQGRYESKKLSLSGSIKGLPTHTGAISFDGGGGFKADLTKGTAELTGWRLASEPAVLKLSLKASGIGKALTVSGPVNIEPFNPRELAKKMNYRVPPMQSDKALTSFQMQGEVDVTPKQAMLDKLNLQVDGNHLTGKLGLADLKTQKILVRLSGGKWNLNPYLPPASTQGKPKPAAPVNPAGGGNVKIPLPTEQLRALNLDAQIDFQQLTYQGYVLDQPKLVAAAAGGQVAVNKLSCKAFGGSIDASAGLDVRGSVPAWGAKLTTSSVQLQPLLKAVMREDRLIGTGNLDVDVTAQGDEVDKLKSTLGGKAKFALRNGKVKGIDLGYLLRSAQARLSGTSTEVPKEQSTDFSSITGSATIKNGVIHNSDLRGASPLLRVEGKGDVDLARSRLNYVLTTIVVNTATGQGGKALEKLKKLPIPIKITGTFANPSYGIDMQAVLKEEAKQQIKSQIEKKLGGSKNAPIKNLLKGFGL